MLSLSSRNIDRRQMSIPVKTPQRVVGVTFECNVWRRHITLLGLILTLCFSCSMAIAGTQESVSEMSSGTEVASPDSADGTAAEETDPPILIQEVPNRAETTSAELATLLPRDSSRQTLKRVAGETTLALQEVKSLLADTRQMLTGRPNVRTLQRYSAQLIEMLSHLQSLEQ